MRLPNSATAISARCRSRLNAQRFASPASGGSCCAVESEGMVGSLDVSAGSRLRRAQHRKHRLQVERNSTTCGADYPHFGAWAIAVKSATHRRLGRGRYPVNPSALRVRSHRRRSSSMARSSRPGPSWAELRRRWFRKRGSSAAKTRARSGLRRRGQTPRVKAQEQTLLAAARMRSWPPPVA